MLCIFHPDDCWLLNTLESIAARHPNDTALQACIDFLRADMAPAEMLGERASMFIEPEQEKYCFESDAPLKCYQEHYWTFGWVRLSPKLTMRQDQSASGEAICRSNEEMADFLTLWTPNEKAH